MKRATLERLAAVLVLAACICAECIPLLLALVALYALKRILARYGKGLGDLFKPMRPKTKKPKK